MNKDSLLGWTVALSGAITFSGPVAADVILDWNNVMLQTIREVGGKPGPIARALAMMHVSMYDAVNSIDRTHDAYLSLIDAPAGTSAEAAAASAAHRVLVELYPARQQIYDTALAASLTNVPDGPDEDAGVALGIAAAEAIIQARANDGSDTTSTYTISTQPGSWRPTFPDFNDLPYTPGWGTTLPWTMIDGAQFRPRGPAGKKNLASLLHSKEYADQVNEVKAIGALNSTIRTDEQTQIAFFWANDVLGTCKPPGQQNQIAQAVSQQQQLNLVQNARLFAILNLALADAGVVAWDCKYLTKIDLWRPISAIRLADTDGNNRTKADPNWEPLNPFSPPFPAYISGHATFSAAAAAVMADFFGTDNITFTIDSDDPYYAQLPQHPPRTFHSFSEAAWENAMSRLYLGVHYRFDADDGNAAGTAVGHYVYEHVLKAVH